jgi:PLP dependent protein
MPASRLSIVAARMAAATAEAGRGVSDVTLIAVSKTFDADAIRPVLATGHRVFGENRVQEAKGKWPALQEEFPGVELHLIGPLQTNKAAEAVEVFDVIQTLDRPKMAAALSAAIAKIGRTPRLFIQVNTGDEPQKAGIAVADVAGFLSICRIEHELSPTGLMCIPPVEDDPTPHFQLLARLARELGLPHLSMGMSGDFPAAIAAGATHVRVGSAIFGTR